MRRVAAFTALWRTLRGRRGPTAPPLRRQLLAVPRMVRLALSGRYPGLDRTRLLLMAGALLYVVSPVDLVPEAAFLLVGLTDDAVVLSWLAGALLSETEAFLRWEDGGSVEAPAEPSTTDERVVAGEVVT